MKKSIFLLVFAAFIGFTAQAQKVTADKVPATVTSAFKAKYPNVTTPTWTMKGTDYQANFKMSNQDMTANFDSTGKWVQTETKIASTSLPSAVQTSLKKDFADYKTEQACKVITASNSSEYSAKVAKGTEKYEVVFSNDGKVISKTKV